MIIRQIFGPLVTFTPEITQEVIKKEKICSKEKENFDMCIIMKFLSY